MTYHKNLKGFGTKNSARMSVILSVVCVIFFVGTASAASPSADMKREAPQTPQFVAADGSILLPIETKYNASSLREEEVHYSISMMGGEAARAALHIGAAIDDAELGRVVPLQGLVSSVGFLSALVKFKYGGLTYVDVDTGYPVWSEKLLEDSGRSRTYTTFYARDEYRADVVRSENGKNSPRTRMIPRYSDDMFTWLMRLRQADLAVGDVYVAYIFDGWLVRRLTLRVISHADRPVRVGSNETVRAAEIAIQTESLAPAAPLPWAEDAVTLPPVYSVEKREQAATMWFSLDARRVPLHISLQTPVGFVRMELTKYVAPKRESR